jgi:hypothetical protein
LRYINGFPGNLLELYLAGIITQLFINKFN